jgi:hypothetical protein
MKCDRCNMEFDEDESDADDPDTFCSSDCEDEAAEDGEIDDE